MTWDPGPRPAWVRHVLDGEGGPVYEEARRPFERDQLLAEAALRAGLDDFGDDDFVEPLDVFLRSIETEAGLHLVGRWRAREVVLRALENRLRVLAAVVADPAVRDERIEAPIIVTGSPRAGTSIMHELLACHPGVRVPMAWEYWSPAPPPEPASYDRDPRIPLADRDVRLSAALAPAFDAMHEQGARVPREDPSAMLPTFRSDVLVAHYPTPSYRTWFASCDMRPAYEWHHLVLQVLQRRMPTSTWVTKAPGHLANLPVLLHRYPDARIVVCHRDPLAMLSSVTSLTATLRWAHADDVDFQALARENADHFVHNLDLLLAARRDGLIDPARVHDVRFGDFTADQVGAVAGVYDHFGMPFGDEVRAAVTAHLAAKPAGRHGGHAHSFADLGLDEATERARVADYQAYFAIPSEPMP